MLVYRLWDTAPVGEVHQGPRIKEAEVNIYEMYILNGDVDFWVMRQTWGKTVARVVHVDELTTPAPYYGTPKVLVDLYDIESGALLKKNERLSCPGTSQYSQVDISTWSPAEALRTVTSTPPDPAFRKRMEAADKRAKQNAARKQKRREESEAKPRYYFASNPRFLNEKNELFGENFYVRWDPDKKLWWCLQEDTATQASLKEMGCELQS